MQKPWNLGLKPPKPVQNADEDDFFLTFCGCESLDAGQFTSQARPKKCRWSDLVSTPNEFEQTCVSCVAYSLGLLTHSYVGVYL